MYVFLTDEELSSEESLFAPHRVSYKRLEVRIDDIRAFTLPGTESSADSNEAPEKEKALHCAGVDGFWGK